ncbi:MAG: Sulfate adenylyltransferase [Actinomycetota bacterium]|nr:Sulfate adenylyltransferase [Actinomycetota bacterium]
MPGTITARPAARPPGPGRNPAGPGLLRLATAGSVDDGKSTLVGRLLRDTRSVLADQMAAVRAVSRDRGLADADLALFTDGLRAEREQGITIDVAYRYFATAHRAFVLADTPGHVQYTRNMVTGASTAQVVVVLVDARSGVREQTCRHAAVAALLRVPNVVLAVNKMDLVGYSPEVFAAVRDRFGRLAAGLGVPDVVAVPVCALSGENVVTAADSMPWYSGPTLLEHLETVPVARNPGIEPFRLPVQLVLRPGSSGGSGRRRYAGLVASGRVRVGDELVVQPAGAITRVVELDGPDGPVEEACRSMSVTVAVADDLDIGRGDLLSGVAAPARTTREVRGIVCWLGDRPLTAGARVLLHVATRTVPALVDRLDHRLDVATLQREPTDRLCLNDLGGIVLRTAEPVALDDYRDNRCTGAFLVVDPADGSTLAAGMAGDVASPGTEPAPAVLGPAVPG